MDRGAWRATVHGVMKNWTRLSSQLTWRTAGLRQFSTDHKLPFFIQKNQSFTYLQILEDDVANFSCYQACALWAHPLTATHVTTTTIPSEHILVTLPERNFATYKSFLFCYISIDILMFPLHWYPDFSGPLWFHMTKGKLYWVIQKFLGVGVVGGEDRENHFLLIQLWSVVFFLNPFFP